MLLISDGTLKVSKFYFTFLQLEDYHRFKVFNYERYDPAGDNNINLNNADSVRDFQQSLLYDLNQFAYWEARNFGLSQYLALGAQFIWPFSYSGGKYWLNPQTYQIGVVCMGQYFNADSFPDFCNDALDNSPWG